MFEGFVDECNFDVIRGWARNTKSDNPIYLDIYFNDIHTVKLLANIYREDLKQTKKGNGCFGFEISVTRYLQEGTNNKIDVKYADNGSNLINSPFNIQTFILEQSQKIRSDVAKKYLHGEGIEIGALHNPLNVSDVKVKYVDRICNEDLKTFYSDIKTEMVNVDIIDDGETLSTIKSNSLDFIICNHMLEHCINPIGTIENHLQKLKTNGILFYCIPDKRYTFDVERPLTEISHLFDDYYGNCDNFNHYVDWVKYYLKFSEDKVNLYAEELKSMEHNIHFHVWDFYSFSIFLNRVRNCFNEAFEILHYQLNENEIISVLKKLCCNYSASIV